MPGVVQLLRLLVFLVFVGLGLRLAATRDGAGRRRAITTLVGYVLIVSGLVLLNGMVRLREFDGWPFTTHTIATMRANARARQCIHEFRAVDDGGREWGIDPLSWSPVNVSILQSWVNLHLHRLSEPERRAVLGFLLEKAERSRARLAAGQPIGYDVRLGRLSAPYWWMLPRVTAVPAAPYTGLRVYYACSVPTEWVDDRTRASRTLVAEHPGR